MDETRLSDAERDVLGWWIDELSVRLHVIAKYIDHPEDFAEYEFGCVEEEEEEAAAKAAYRAAHSARMRSAVDPDQFYPRGSKRREEEGSPVVEACVDAKGNLVKEPVLAETSGFPELDRAAIEVSKANRYAAGSDERGRVMPESCVRFKVKFTINSD